MRARTQAGKHVGKQMRCYFLFAAQTRFPTASPLPLPKPWRGPLSIAFFPSKKVASRTFIYMVHSLPLTWPIINNTTYRVRILRCIAQTSGVLRWPFECLFRWFKFCFPGILRARVFVVCGRSSSDSSQQRSLGRTGPHMWSLADATHEPA